MPFPNTQWDEIAAASYGKFSALELVRGVLSKTTGSTHYDYNNAEDSRGTQGKREKWNRRHGT